MKSIRMMAWTFSLLCVAACGGGATPEPAAPANPATPPAAADQAAAGAKLYVANCASCHGANGEGNAQAPALVGKTALPLDAQPPSKARKTQFHTAADVLAFIKMAMPPTKPGSLTDDEYADILAFDLKANGVDLTGKKVDASTAASFVLHP